MEKFIRLDFDKGFRGKEHRSSAIGDGIRLDHIGGKTGRGRVQHKRSCTLTTASNAGVIGKKFRVRRLTPRECFRLQGFPAIQVVLDRFYPISTYKFPYMLTILATNS
ncbi:TPA: DNA cytosine methyltransferase [Clostridioides difficile]|uniref:DNA cytosine methyltransferase n=2 Tax=Clostridioides difficile TaxID=1496 RepID=UPI00092CB86F|nr:DNA cytosine methyltransferase [Clostridioides difficile]MCM4142192.1 DNA cytosine methyltransferase [Clostridioides difficile]MCP2722934.1 DNA cytosine methyltransferase [Clostridioides difficile]MCZ1055108.1 DNA cytosine methyltransferase [Clostridioides difficile]MDK3358818.1 DNA cytosine methyltransferase [Clostridioides difficile]OJT74433.1 hypothetical protein BM530_15225 [Clostridioides difficile]